jgi:hypothetical protein
MGQDMCRTYRGIMRFLLSSRIRNKKNLKLQMILTDSNPSQSAINHVTHWARGWHGYLHVNEINLFRKLWRFTVWGRGQPQGARETWLLSSFYIIGNITCKSGAGTEKKIPRNETLSITHLKIVVREVLTECNPIHFFWLAIKYLRYFVQHLSVLKVGLIWILPLLENLQYSWIQCENNQDTSNEKRVFGIGEIQEPKK